MKKDLAFHVYKKDTPETEVIDHNLTEEELSERMIDKRIDTSIHEIIPVHGEVYEEASF